MDPEIAARIDSLNAVIWTLAALVLFLCAIVVRLPEEPKSSDPTCPIHKIPRSTCKPEWH